MLDCQVWLTSSLTAGSVRAAGRSLARFARPDAGVLGFQSTTGGSLAKGAMRAARRSLPDMSLAFALMAAINSSTGSCATLSHGL